MPAFVTRTRYARFIPAVSPAVRMLGGPFVDPKRDPRGSLAAVREAAPRQRHGLILFPEGHRSKDGELQPFKTAGAQAIAGGPPHARADRRDGRRLEDAPASWTSCSTCHLLRVRTEVLESSSRRRTQSEVPAFLQELRARMEEHLARMRADAAA